MVSFNCAKCNDVVTKPKVIKHAQQCGTTRFSCVDCMENFTLDTIHAHTKCMTEAHRYQGQWRRTEGKPHTEAVDSEEEEAKKKGLGSTKRAGLLPPQRPAMSFSDSDDEAPTKAARKEATVPPPKRAPTEAARKEASVVAPKQAPTEAAKPLSITIDLGSPSTFLSMIQSSIDVEPDGVGVKALAKHVAACYEARITKTFAAAITHFIGHNTVGLDVKDGKVTTSSAH